MEEKSSRTWKTKNALVTVHGFSAGTAILNIQVFTGDSPNRAAVWMSPEELRDLGLAISAYSIELGKG